MPDPVDVDDEKIVRPFGATLAGVKALVPEAELLTTEPAVGEFGVTEVQVMAWLEELSGAVALRLDGWDNLATTVPSYGDGTYGGEQEPAVGYSDREQLVRFARTVVLNGTASYLEAARHPERSSVNDTSYAAVLWERYVTGLDAAAAWLERRLDDPESGDTDPSQRGPLFEFPEPLIGDGLRF